MTIKLTHIMPPGKAICLCVGAVLLASSAMAQVSLKREKYDSIANKYKNENAVYTDYSYKLEITENEGVISANSHVKIEKLLISDLSLNMYNNDHFTYSDFNIPTRLSGVSYIPEKNAYKKVDATGFGEGGVETSMFYDDYRYMVSYFSGLKKNSIIETDYSLEHADINMLPDCDMQMGLPLLHGTFEVSAPKFVKMEFVYKGLGTDKIVRTEEEKNNVVTYKFTVTDMPAYKLYDNVPSAMYYIPHIIPYIVSYRLTGASKDSVLSKDADALHRFENKYVRGLNIQTDTFINKVVDEITKNDRTEMAKARHICEWIEKNMHYIGFEKGLQGFIPRPADTVFKRKYGDCKDMASLSMAMCHRAGLKAYFTVIGTTYLPYNHKDVPLTRLWNHMICAVKVDGKWMYIDGTHPELPFGHYRDDVQGKEAMILIDDNNYEIVTMPVQPASLSSETDSTNMTLSYNNMTGVIKHHRTGYPAWDGEYSLRYRKNDELDRAMRAALMRGTDKFVLTKYEINESADGNKDMDVNGTFTLDDYAQRVGKQYYINMNINRRYADDRVNDSERKVGLYFDYKFKGKDIVVLNIPDDCKVTYVPKDAAGSMDGFLSYKITYKTDAKKKTITRTAAYELQTMSVDPKQFKASNKLVDELKNAYKESVVLTAKK